MPSLLPTVKLWYCPEPTDMRLGFDGLFARVRNRLQADPLFIFRNRLARGARVTSWRMAEFRVQVARGASGHRI
jgi:hypothetical protein